jgi:REP element-mobilizing transposase RayT
MRDRARQLSLTLKTWGGRREGAGRKPSGATAGVPHRSRPPHDRRHSLHVTLRAVAGLPPLRSRHLFSWIQKALTAASQRTFRVVHFSVQSNHVHLLVEADGARVLSRGMQGLGIRLARTVNRLLARRGSVWRDRFHARALPTPREVRNALVYVLMNWRKHRPSARGIDPCSSGRWFAGWRSAPPASGEPAPVARARTWLLAVGWRRWGAIRLNSAPVPSG